MFRLNIFNSKTARSGFYIIFVGGLFAFLSAALAYFWGAILCEFFSMPSINFLEACGMIASFYIIGFGIRFGIKSDGVNLADDKTASNGVVESSYRGNDCIKNMTKEEKEELSEAIAKCCGMPREIEKNVPSLH